MDSPELAARHGDDPRVIVALDFSDAAGARGLAARLDPAHCALKVGSELFTAAGPELVRELVGRGFRVFLDLKFHDIPNTVGQACAAAMRLGVWMLNVHAAGGEAMMRAARSAVTDTSRAMRATGPLVIAVTVLTSLDNAALALTGVSQSAADHALRLARLARQCGMDGVVCSAAEARMLKGALGRDFLLVTPGIRPAGAATHDQARVMTPGEAIAAGADYLVIGRAITGAADPVRALAEINAALGHAA